MCDRYLLQQEEENTELRQIIREVNERFKDTPLLASMKTGEVFPTNVAPVLVPGRDKEQATLMKWGFPKGRAEGQSVASYHERIPLVLEADKVNDWLHDEAYALDCIQSPWEADLLLCLYSSNRYCLKSISSFGGLDLIIVGYII